MKPARAWTAAIISAVAVLAASVAWMRANPLPAYYDETLYAIYALIDAWAWKSYGVAGVFYSMLKVDPASPPALRLLALPFTLIVSPSLAVLRVVSLSGLFIGAAVSALALKRASGAVAAALAFLFTIALPSVVQSTQMFHTEYALLIAVALLLVGVSAPHPRFAHLLPARGEKDDYGDARTALLIAASVALGLLSKASYPVMAAPMLIAAAFLLRDRRRGIAIGAIIGLGIGAIWWSQNFAPAMDLVSFASRFPRHSLRGSYLRYAYELLRCNFGFGAAAAVLLCFATAALKRMLPPLAIVSLAGALPIIALHAAGVGHNPRHIAIAALLITYAGAALIPELTVRQQMIAFGLVIAQVAVMTFPIPRRDDGSYIWRGASEVMAPTPQWDWSRLRRFAGERGLARPRVAMLGEGYAFNAPQVRYGWPGLRGEVPVEGLYEWIEHKPFDLEKAIERSAVAQLVITPVGYRGEASDGQVPNNLHNAEFAAALAHDPRFEGPYLLDVGLHHPAVVHIFVRR